MRHRRIVLASSAIVFLTIVQALAAPFVVFPKARELASPDGRFVVRNVERAESPTEFVGTFRSLWLVEVATGRARKLCDYVGVAAVMWSKGDFLVVTQYVAKTTSRAMVFSAADPENPVVLDKPGLILRVPADLRPALEENNHVFIEASQLEDDTLYVRVWGYGAHDPSGFRWRCRYATWNGTVACTVERGSR